VSSSARFEARFGQAADEYQRYRPDYPAALYEHILAEIPERERIRAMDLGAGTGIVTGHLTEWFREVIAVEPDAKMAAKIAERFPRIIICAATAEDCEQPADSANLITIANALHWMKAERTFANARKWLGQDGVLAVFDRPLPKANAAIDAVVLAEWRGPWKPHRDPRLNRDLHWQDEVRAAAGFEVMEETRIPHMVPMSPAEYAGFWSSSSYGSAYARTLAEPATYWKDLESRIGAAAKDDMIFVDFSSTLILAHRT
jgi:SAM-dependent methyltransferase